jgi:hypothetical protein
MANQQPIELQRDGSVLRLAGLTPYREISRSLKDSVSRPCKGTGPAPQASGSAADQRGFRAHFPAWHCRSCWFLSGSWLFDSPVTCQVHVVTGHANGISESGSLRACAITRCGHGGCWLSRVWVCWRLPWRAAAPPVRILTARLAVLPGVAESARPHGPALA